MNPTKQVVIHSLYVDDKGPDVERIAHINTMLLYIPPGDTTSLAARFMALLEEAYKEWLGNSGGVEFREAMIGRKYYTADK